MTKASIFLIIMFCLYNCQILNLVDSFLEKPRLNKILYIPLSIINALIITGATVLCGGTSFCAYIIISIILFLSFFFLHRDKASGALFCTLACSVHIMSIRSICVSVFAIATESSMYEVVHTPFSFRMTTAITFLLLNFAIGLVIKFIPAKGVKIINQHSEQRWFMNIVLIIFSIYLLVNSEIYRSDISSFNLLINQIMAPTTLLLGTYIMLFFSFNTGKLLGYKDKNEELQQMVENERQIRITFDKDVFRILEVDFTKNEIIKGFEEYKEQLGEMIYNYSEMCEFIIQTVVHMEDREKLVEYVLPAFVMKEFEMGQMEKTIDYRRLMPDGKYVWMQIYAVLMRDKETNNIRGLIQIKDIDVEKKEQMELQYKAERDLLTGLYNKGTTEILISEYLKGNTGSLNAGVLFIIDIDNFKMINDNFGHLYGDAVLSELSENLQKVFRDDDIVGRIGGDEFLVFVKDMVAKSTISKKAMDICEAFHRTYKNEKNIGCTVSGSIGIAIFPRDGKTFEDMFKCVDIALYTTKAKGKNGYSFYDKELEMPHISTRTEIDTQGRVQKNFKNNKIEYIFRMLYEAEDNQVVMESLLELIAKTFHFSRANIFECIGKQKHLKSVFEWCVPDLDSIMDLDIGQAFSDFIISTLEASNEMLIAVSTDFPIDEEKKYTFIIEIKSIVYYAIKERGQIIGVIAFQNCKDEKIKFSNIEFEELQIIGQILSIFIAKFIRDER